MSAECVLDLIQHMCPSAKIEYTGGFDGQFYVGGDIEIREGELLSSQRFHAGTPAETVRGYFDMLTKVKQPSLINVGGTSQKQVWLWNKDNQCFEYHGSLNNSNVRDIFFPRIK